ncbi:MAG: magnesium transporter CorA family protein [Limnohabitans sp.]
MRVLCVAGHRVEAGTALPTQLPEGGFVWIACSRSAFAQETARVQAALEQLCGQSLVDLHVSDLLNDQLPSHFDYSAQYDLLVFRRLAQASGSAPPVTPAPAAGKRPGPPVLQRIDTRPVGFAVFDRVLLSVHPDDCAVREAYAARLLAAAGAASAEPDLRSTGARGVPRSPADMMLRIISQMVDGYLDLRRELGQQLGHWQTELLNPRARFSRWEALLHARGALHQLEALCEDQRTALQGWTESLEAWAANEAAVDAPQLDLLKIRSRDVLEHIDRVVQHVRRLEHSTETAVQMHFNVQSNRTNDIMRTLTALTAIFLPLNLVAGIFGMNFEFMPWLHTASAFWWTLGGMAAMALGLGLVFWRKRYLAQQGR